MKFRRAVAAFGASLMLVLPTMFSGHVYADDDEETDVVEASSINTLAKKYDYGGTTYLYKMLKTEGIKYNCFYTNNKIKYRKGKPEGIVIHETATPGASAHNEAIYFNREWKNIYSYVHAFVDHTGTIQMMTPKYGVWGAGPVANDRYLQVELCEESTRTNFAKSVNNDAIYAAKLLHRYDIKPNNASSDGKGTVWSHHAVSKYLGGTDHTDPDGYFSKWNYSMSQFYSLLKYYYNLQAAQTEPTLPANPNEPNTTDSSATDNTSSTVSQAPSSKKTLMHDAYVYDGQGKRVSDTLKTAGTSVTVNAEKTINNKKYLEIGDNQYVVASNVNGRSRTLKHNAYVYDTVGMRTADPKLYRGHKVTTYGGRVNIQGVNYYQIDVNKFVKVANF